MLYVKGMVKKNDLIDWTQKRTLLVLKNRSIKSFLPDTKRKKKKKSKQELKITECPKYEG